MESKYTQEFIANLTMKIEEHEYGYYTLIDIIYDLLDELTGRLMENNGAWEELESLWEFKRKQEGINKQILDSLNSIAGSLETIFRILDTLDKNEDS